ncbi:MAG TPA: hypothetical protein VF755_13915, partial [Catenuloplanes sp.]
MVQTPWWGLPLVAVLFALGGVLVTALVTSRTVRASRQRSAENRWYTDRWSAYVTLLAAFQRSLARMRRGFEEGTRTPDLMLYHSEVGAALAQVRLVAPLPVRNAALAVHRLIEDIHQPRAAPSAIAGAEPEFLERLAHVPLLLQAFEVAVREDLDIDPN